MVLFACFLWLLLIYADSYIHAKDKDFFSPLRFVTLRFMLQHLPFILFFVFFPKEFLLKILLVCGVTLEDAFVKYTLVQTIAYYSLVWGIRATSFKKKAEDRAGRYTVNIRALLYMAILLYITGLFAYCVFLTRIGGLQYLFSHISERIILQRGQYILGLLNLFYIVPLLLMLRLVHTKQMVDKILLVLSVVTYLFIANSLGAREPTIVFIAVLVAGYNYIFRPFVFNKKMLLLCATVVPLFVVYMLAVPLLRHDFKGMQAKELLGHRGVKKFVYQTSYVYIDVFSCNYFNENNAWKLDGYFAPIRAINAKGDKKEIPEVDQGVYFRSIVMDRKYYKPPLPRGSISEKSWPTENFGFAYANFLLPGIIVFYFLQGFVFGMVYNFRNRNPENVVTIVLYVFVLLYFNFSSLRLAFFVKTLPLLCICWFVFTKFAQSKPKNNALL